MTNAAALPTMTQIEQIFGSHEAAHTYLLALKAAGAPVTVDTCHFVRMGGAVAAPLAAAPGFSYRGGSRALGLL